MVVQRRRLRCGVTSATAVHASFSSTVTSLCWGRLETLFAAHPRLKAAWDALGELHGLYLAKDQMGALAALDRIADIFTT